VGGKRLPNCNTVLRDRWENTNCLAACLKKGADPLPFINNR